MRVAISGGTSYTGSCIAVAFARAGHETVALCRAPIESYQGLRRLRLERMLAARVEVKGELSADNGAMAAWIGSRRFDVWIHHHHPMEDFRAPSYDVTKGRAAAIAPLDGIFTALVKAQVRAFILSGTYFEPGEGGRSEDAPATPYALLKRELSNEVLKRAVEAQLAFAKIVISAPIGALENDDRLTPQLLRAAATKTPYLLRSPDSVMDLIPGDVLADVYVATAMERLSADQAAPRIRRPSGWVGSTGEWARIVQTTLLPHLGQEGNLELAIADAEQRAPAVAFFNPPSERVDIDWDKALRDYAEEWKETQPFR